MSDRDDRSDRDLLFGITALRLNLIDREALISATDAWLLDRAKSLGQILSDQGTLRPEDRAVVEDLLARGPADELDGATVFPGASTSHDPGPFATPERTDSEVHATVSSLVLTRVSEEDDARLSRRDFRPETEGDLDPEARFRRVRLHAKGGLGQIYLAKDVELEREVALKEIQPRWADHPSSRDRFEKEARVTGGLEHPGIVPVHARGRFEDGRPFYVMRFIQGESLEDRIQAFHDPERGPRDPVARSIELRRLLRRFLDVCNAVAYAHSRKVLHRDLKPGNIMVGKFGETLLVDWGLAKPLNPTSESDPDVLSGDEPPLPVSGTSEAATLPGTRVGTPAYMAPEQASGRADLHGTATDVYGLGATLYCLLTGRPPCSESSLQETLRKAESGEIVPPRRLRPDVPPALDAICLKATARLPEDRYESALDLAADIEHWLADEAVTARRETPLEWAARFLRRNKSTAVSAALAMAIITIVASASAVFIGTARRKTEEALLAESKAKTEALANFRSARSAVDDYLDVVSKDVRLKSVPGLERLRVALLRKAQDYYDGFLERHRDDPSLEKDVALAAFRLGRAVSEIGDVASGIPALERSRALLERLVRNDPADLDAADALAATLNNLGLLLRAAGKIVEAEASYDQARVIRERLVSERPEVADYRFGMASTLGNLGVLKQLAGRVEESKADYKRAGELYDKLVAEHPDVPEYQEGLASTLANLGNVDDSAADAEELYSRSMSLRERLLIEHPDVDPYRDGLSMTLMNLGNIRKGLGRPREAESAYRQSRKLRERLVVDHPEVAEYREGLAMTVMNLALLVAETGRIAEAEALHRESIEVRERLVADHPEVAGYREGLAISLGNLGVFLGSSGRFAESESIYLRARDLREKLTAEHPENVSYRLGLAKTIGGLSMLADFLDRPKDAELLARQAIEETGKSLSIEPNRLDILADRAGLEEQAGLSLLRRNRNQESAAYLRSAVSDRTRIVDRSPEYPGAKRGLLRALAFLGKAELLSRGPLEAAPILRERLKQGETDHEALYEIALAFSYCSTLLDRLASAEAERCRADAVSALTKAFETGFQDVSRIERDPFFRPIRRRPDYLSAVLPILDRAFPADPFNR